MRVCACVCACVCVCGCGALPRVSTPCAQSRPSARPMLSDLWLGRPPCGRCNNARTYMLICNGRAARACAGCAAAAGATLIKLWLQQQGRGLQACVRARACFIVLGLCTRLYSVVVRSVADMLSDGYLAGCRGRRMHKTMGATAGWKGSGRDGEGGGGVEWLRRVEPRHPSTPLGYLEGAVAAHPSDGVVQAWSRADVCRCAVYTHERLHPVPTPVATRYPRGTHAVATR